MSVRYSLKLCGITAVLRSRPITVKALTLQLVKPPHPELSLSFPGGNLHNLCENHHPEVIEQGINTVADPEICPRGGGGNDL